MAVNKNPYKRVLGVFVLSGVAALMYQVCWQRLLFAAFGVDIESITIIVSVFMFGLGMGALAGGRIADRFPEKIIPLFAIFELLIGIFGLLSPVLIKFMAQTFVLAPLPVVGLVNFLLLLLPTSLMGATLPMLTTHLNRHLDNVGSSIGSLYFFNTIGAAAGALLPAFVLFNYITLNQTIYLACFVNLLVVVLVAGFIRKVA